MKRFFIIGILLFLFSEVFSQNVKGIIYDKQTGETLVGVNVYYKDRDNVVGVSSGVDGSYELALPDGGAIINFSFVGYESESHPIVIRKNQNIELDIYLVPKAELMREVVVSAGRFEQKLSEITVSMEVLKPAEIIKQNPRDLSVVINTLPGVDVVDKQPSIRGGSGWTYGVGSRSLVLVDGMSILTPSVGDVNWNFIPLQNVAQVEILKGASSVLYGSSALNGLINIRTQRPGFKPETRVNAYQATYLDPKNEGYVWWEKDYWYKDKFPVSPLLRNSLFYGIRNPMYAGTDISHSRRIGNFDVTLGADMYTNEGYRQGDYTQRTRVGGNVTYHDKKITGMNYGLNANFMSNNYGGFFIWKSADEAYSQSPMANMSRQGNMLYVDPFFNYTNPRNNTMHRIRGRYFYKSDQIFTHPTSESLLDITADMGFNPSSINVDTISYYIQNPAALAPILLEFIAPYTNGSSDIRDWDYVGLSKAAAEFGKQYFPDATTPDLVNMFSWISGHTPFPQNSSEILPWLASSNTPTISPADFTSSYFLDYQFNKQLRTAQFTTGTTYNHVDTKSPNTGPHVSDNIAAFFQYDQKFIEKLNVSLGMRLEYYRVDSLLKEAETKIFGVNVPFRPVLRGGLNYELAEHTFIRASFGQGYRYPGLTEKFIYKSIGGIAAYPNKNLLPESGFNTEIGLKQGYKVGRFMGYLDVAGFYTAYKDMIEFQFGLFDNTTYEYIDDLTSLFVNSQGEPDYTIAGLINAATNILNGQYGFGTRFSNVDNARIYGIDASINGIFKINPACELSYSLGYVFIEPIDPDWKSKAEAEDQALAENPFVIKEKSNSSKYLKYRQKHSFKLTCDFQWNRFSIGTNMAYKSKTLAVDYFMVDERQKDQEDIMDVVREVIFPGLHDYWMEHNKGYFAMDARLGVKVNNYIQVWAMVNNLLNTEYSLRPMDVSAPQTLIFQINAKF